MSSSSILIMNSHVFTADPTQPYAEAVGIQGNRIVFVGSNQQAQDWRTNHTRIIDGQGATLMPGIIDSHYHLFLGSAELGHLQLWEVHTLDQLTQVIQNYIHQYPDEESVHGVQLRYELMPPDDPLTRHHLDAIVSDRPLILMAYDHHTAWANTRALETAGVLYGAKTGPNSAITMGTDGLATGELVEPAAYCVVLAQFAAWGRTVKGLMGETVGKPKLDAVRERRLLRQGLQMAARYGITSVHNMDGDAEQAGFYADMEREGELTLRVSVPYSIFPSTPIHALDDAVEMARMFQSGKVRSNRVKIFMDGVLESRTALLLDDYADRSGWRGDALYSVEHFNQLAEECDRRKLQITVHAVGDGAVRRTLDGYERAQHINGVRDSRHRIEHIELIHPDDLPRFKQLGVIASMQPLHSPIDYPTTHEVSPLRLGSERWHRAYPWQYVREAGARLAFGSDYPVVTADPMLTIAAALNRRAWQDGLPDHRQSVADTLISYTREGAYAEFQEGVKGQIKVGMLADLVLMSSDLFNTSPSDLERIHPVLTICDGQITYEA